MNGRRKLGTWGTLVERFGLILLGIFIFMAVALIVMMGVIFSCGTSSARHAWEWCASGLERGWSRALIAATTAPPDYEDEGWSRGK